MATKSELNCSTESLSNLLQNYSLKELLEKNQQATELFDERLAWFFGKITRDAAEQLLLKEGSDGHFLVRESVTASGSFVLSLVYNQQCSHYQIQRHGPDAYFSIDEGPVIHGLEKLIENYYTNADGLPVQLQTFSKGKPPPFEIRKHGHTNILHKAIKEDCKSIIEEIIKCNSVDINSKNEDGETPLQMATLLGQDQTVFHLLSVGANVHYKDSNGDSLLQLACRTNKPSIVSLLINNDGADPQARATKNGWVALHEAANAGHIECVKILLAMNAPHRPRTKQNETPEDLAAFNNHRHCVKMLENYKPPSVKVSRTEWLHENIDRTSAQKILENNGSIDGLFLVRRSSKKEGFYVLTMMHNNNPYNFEIRSKLKNNKKVYYIDDGPYLDSLEHIVDHYLRQSDGLPIKLSQAVSPVSNCIENQRNALPEPPPLPARDMSPVMERKVSELPTPPPAASIPDQEIKIELIKIEALILGREIGEGEFGSVLKGIWKDKQGKQVSVAVKTLREDNIQTGTQEFLREAAVMMGLNHQCIVRLIGVVQGPPFMLVQELVPLGSMLDFLLDYPERINPKLDLYLWAAQIACGMMYLEHKRFVHRDLAARNILLASKRQAKISDFGLSRTLGSGSDYYRASAGGRWPVKWYAPESINYGTFSHASDIWSFGVTLWEMFSFGQQPYGSMTGAQVVQFIEQNQRLPQAMKCPDNIYCIMLQCWSHDASQRPTFEELNCTFNTDPEYANTKHLVPHSIIV